MFYVGVLKQAMAIHLNINNRLTGRLNTTFDQMYL